MFSKLKAALSSVILAKDRDSAVTAEDVLYEGQTMSGLTRITQNANGIRILRFGQNGPRQSVVKMGDLDYLGLPYAKAAMIGLAFTDQVERILVIGLGGGCLRRWLNNALDRNIRRHHVDAVLRHDDIRLLLLEAHDRVDRRRVLRVRLDQALALPRHTDAARLAETVSVVI